MLDQFKAPPADVAEWYLHFYCYDPAFPVLGRCRERHPDLSAKILFTIGLASIALVTDDPNGAAQLEAAAGQPFRSRETWTIAKSRVTRVTVTCEPSAIDTSALRRLRAYEGLPTTVRTIVDEFAAAMAVMLPKVAVHIPNELVTFTRLMELVDVLVEELLYVTKPTGPVPQTLSEYGAEEFLRQPALCETILHQNTDRLVQITSALSYVSTQALSGAVPILERRSLIRRYSLLGIGSAVLAVTRLARSIEVAFTQAGVEPAIEAYAAHARPLPGLDNLPDYDVRDWESLSVNRWPVKPPDSRTCPRLPYFSGRLGFRETEYTISAALQSLVGGASPEWSLLTLTHEMVHGHVRNLLSQIIGGDPRTRLEDARRSAYDKFSARILKRPVVDETLLDSIRALIFTYCCLTMEHGSLTSIPGEGRKAGTEIRRGFRLPEYDDLWSAVEHEYRNINEVLVHVLDLHYFYLSRVSLYIPLIWRSWSVVPHVMGDPRQYVLRSLLAIASQLEGTPYQRFRLARGRLSEMLGPLSEQAIAGKGGIRGLFALLGDDAYMEDELFPPFLASLVLVDLGQNLLTSSRIRGNLLGGDENVVVAAAGDGDDEHLSYSLGEGFSDAVVRKPAALLADRLAARIARSIPDGSLEAETALLFLACCSGVPDGGEPC